MASIPSNSAVIYPSVMLKLEHIFSIVVIARIFPNILLLYDSWCSGCPGVVLVAVIIGWDIFLPLMMRAAVLNMFLKYLSLTTIAMPACGNMSL